LGVLRTILACAVLLTHTGGFLLFNITAGGIVPVEIFYIISGFYMSLVLNEKYVGPGTWHTFYTNRLVRLLPVYWVVALGALAIYAWIYRSTGSGIFIGVTRLSEQGQWGQISMIAVSNATLLGINYQNLLLVQPAWTLGVELIFYALAPLIVRRHAWLIAGVLMASIMLRLAYFWGVDLGAAPDSYNFFPYELAYFMAGALAYKLYVKVRDRNNGGWIGLSLIVAVLSFQIVQKVFTLSICTCDLVVVPFRVGICVYAAFAIAFLFRDTRSNTMDNRIGELSYPIYLLHYPLIDLYNAIVQPAGTMMGASLRSVIVLAASVVLAAALVRFVERPVEIFLKRPPYRAAPAS
jgi:peptidoglycan/LPS O-acetylase OafA/YrhL